MLASASLPSLRPGADTPTLRLREKSAARLSQSKVRDSIRGEVDRLADWASKSQQRQEPQPDSRTQRPAEVERWITHKAKLPQLGPVKYRLACEAAPFGGQLPRETAKVRGAGASSRARGADISYLADGGGPRRAKARHPPSEAAQGGPSADGRVPQQSEMPRAASLPPSLIPGPFHLMIESPFPLSHVSSFGELPDTSWTKSAVSQMWQACVFPSAVPAGRRDVLLLQEWMTEMLARLAADRTLEEEALVHEAQVRVRARARVRVRVRDRVRVGVRVGVRVRLTLTLTLTLTRPSSRAASMRSSGRWRCTARSAAT